jgi:hypothetical protein
LHKGPERQRIIDQKETQQVHNDRTCDFRKERCSMTPRIAALLLAVLASGPAALADSDVPTGTVAFFNLAACPAGWTPAAYATGRLVLATVDPGRVGVQTGTPLTNAEDRTHLHTYVGSVKVGDKEIAGSDSCCNDSAAEAKTYDFSGTTAPATTRLPFIQLTVCEKQ